MSCKFCGKDASSLQHSKDWIGGMCDDCQFHIFGKIHNNVSYDREWTDGNIIVWIKSEKVVNAWAKNGSQAIPKAVYRDLDVLGAILYLKEHNQFCSTCSTPLLESEVALSHFAGRYCEKCAEEYKKNNSGTCSLCRKPHWECYC